MGFYSLGMVINFAVLIINYCIYTTKLDDNKNTNSLEFPNIFSVRE